VAQLSTLRGYVRDELGELTAGRWSDAQLNSWLNRGVDYLAAEYYRGKCWQLLLPMHRDITYTLTASTATYSVYDMIATIYSTALGRYQDVSYYGFIKAILGNYICHEASVEELNRVLATYGEYAPTTTEPYIAVWGCDKTETTLAYKSGTTDIRTSLDQQILGFSSSATALLSRLGTLTGGTFASGSAAGKLYLHEVSGTFANSEVLYCTQDGVLSGWSTANGSPITEDHHKLPFITLYPTPTTAETLHFYWLREPIAMSAATDVPYVSNSDELLILYAAARAWKADRNFEMHAGFWQEFNMELQKKIANYTETAFQSL